MNRDDAIEILNTALNCTYNEGQASIECLRAAFNMIQHFGIKKEETEIGGIDCLWGEAFTYE